MKWGALTFKKLEKFLIYLKITRWVGVMIAIRYQDTYHVLPDRLKEKAFTPRTRKPLSKIAFIEELDNGIILQEKE
jgi:hypothetical protein